MKTFITVAGIGIFCLVVLGCLGFHARVVGMSAMGLGAIIGLCGALIEPRRRDETVGDILWRAHRGKFNRTKN